MRRERQTAVHIALLILGALIPLASGCASSGEPSDLEAIPDEAFRVLSSTPEDGESQVPHQNPIQVRVRGLVDPGTLDDRGFYVTDRYGNLVFGNLGMRFDEEYNETVLSFFPEAYRLNLAERYFVQLTGALRDTRFRPLLDHAFSFLVTDQPQDQVGPFLRILSITPGNIVTDDNQSPARYVAFNKRTPIYIRFSEPIEVPGVYSGDFAPVDINAYPGVVIRTIQVVTEEELQSQIEYRWYEILNGKTFSDIKGTIHGGLGGRRLVFVPSEDYPAGFLSFTVVFIRKTVRGVVSQKTFDEPMVAGAFAFTNGFTLEFEPSEEPEQ